MDYMDGPFNYRAQVCDLNARLVCYSNPDCIGNWMTLVVCLCSLPVEHRSCNRVGVPTPQKAFEDFLPNLIHLGNRH